MNLGSAFMLLPFYGEPFRKYHLIHHGNTNSAFDPLWPSLKQGLYANKRWFYILCEMVPLLFTFYLVARKENEVKSMQGKPAGPPVEIKNIIAAFIISGLIIYQFQPSLCFCLGTLFTLNVFSTLRHWCEHLGSDAKKASNTFWFPLGMGIGNHDTHHHDPNISWFVLMTGLLFRRKDTGPLQTIYGVLFRKSFIHYVREQKDNSLDPDNF